MHITLHFNHIYQINLMGISRLVLTATTGRIVLDQNYLHTSRHLVPDHQFIHSDGAILSGKINPTWMCPRGSAYQSENNIFQSRSVGLSSFSIFETHL